METHIYQWKGLFESRYDFDVRSIIAVSDWVVCTLFGVALALLVFLVLFLD